MTIFQPKLPGERFDTSTAREMATREAVEHVRRMSRGFQQHQRTPFGVNPCLVSVENKTGKNLNRLSIVGIDDFQLFPRPEENEDQFKLDAAFRGVVPTEDHAGNFLVLAESLPKAAGGDPIFGKAIISGLIRVQLVQLPGEDSFQFADIIPGNTEALRAKESGSARIVWRQFPDGKATGSFWACVLLGCGGGAADEPAFKLKDALPESNEITWVKAYQGEFDGTLHDGKGGYTYTQDTAHEIWVADLRQLGFHGPAGAVGSFKWKQTKNGPVGEITDLVCS